MSELRNELIKLGSEEPDLRPHIRSILDRMATSDLSVGDRVDSPDGVGTIREFKEDKVTVDLGGNEIRLYDPKDLKPI